MGPLPTSGQLRRLLSVIIVPDLLPCRYCNIMYFTRPYWYTQKWTAHMPSRRQTEVLQWRVCLSSSHFDVMSCLFRNSAAAFNESLRRFLECLSVFPFNPGWTNIHGAEVMNNGWIISVVFSEISQPQDGLPWNVVKTFCWDQLWADRGRHPQIIPFYF